MSSLEQLLTDQFNSDAWQVRESFEGKSKQSYIAENPERKVFVKFDVSVGALDALSDIGVAPKVLSSGESDGRSYIIQEFIGGFHPDLDWFSNHISEVSNLIKRYHEDSELKNVLAKDQTTNYTDLVDNQISFLKWRYGESREFFSEPERVDAKLDQLIKTSKTLQHTKLVPTHDYPNNANFIVSEENIYMIDWDDIILADPMRDVGLFIWRYLPREKWPEFIGNCGLAFDQQAQKRLYWWTARGMLNVSAWFAGRKDREGTEKYLKYFNEAMDELKKVV